MNAWLANPALAQVPANAVWSRTNHTAQINSLRFSFDGQHLLSTSDDGTTRAWNMADGQMGLSVTNLFQKAYDAVFVQGKKNETLIATWSSELIMRLHTFPFGDLLWQVQMPEPDTRQFGLGRHHNLVFDRLGQRYAYGPWRGHITVWNTFTGELLQSLTNDVADISSFQQFTPLDFSPDGLLLVTGLSSRFYYRLQVREIATRRTVINSLSGLGPSLSHVRMSPNGNLIGALTDRATSSFFFYSPTNSVPLGYSSALLPTEPAAGGGVFDFSPDGRSMLITIQDDSIRRVHRIIHHWTFSEAGLQIQRVYQPEEAEITALAISPTGTEFAYGLVNGKVVLARHPFYIDRFARQGQAVSFSWVGGPGRYQIQRRSSLSPGPWENLGPPVSAPQTTNTFTHPLEFFRVIGAPK